MTDNAYITPITQVFWSKSGLAAARPAATGLRDGSLWISTDTKDIDQVQAGAWVTILDYSAIIASVTTTRGDMIRRGASADERLALGASGKALVSDGTDIVWGNVGMWTLLETLSPSGVSSINSSVLALHDLWKVVIDIALDTGVAGEQQITIRFNDDTGDNYCHRLIDNTGVVVTASANTLKVGSIGRNAIREHSFLAILHIVGKALNEAAAYNAVTGNVAMGSAPGYNSLVNGSYKSGTTGIVKMNFDFAVNATGKIKLYYMDY